MSAASSAARAISNNTKRVLHIVRHAESELNVASAHATAGYFPGITGLDAKLSRHGFKQCEALRNRIESECIDDPYSIRQAQVVITSPLSRSILTAKNSMPMNNYQYKVKYEITEQVENTTDIGYHKSDLSKMYPELQKEFNQLPDAWWWQHPQRRSSSDDDEYINTTSTTSTTDYVADLELNQDTPQHRAEEGLETELEAELEDSEESGSEEEEGGMKKQRVIRNSEIDFNFNKKDAQLLISHRGRTPASEPKFHVRRRSLNFLKWLYSDPTMVYDINWNNVAAFSHACTIRELECLLMTINNKMNDVEAVEWSKDDTIRSNTEQITYDLPCNGNEIDWNLLEYRVEQAKSVKNHADFQ